MRQEDILKALLEEKEADHALKPNLPTGACTISVSGVSDTCTSSMTERSCAAVAKNVGGTYDWDEDGTCS